jgi:hypothetical protein
MDIDDRGAEERRDRQQQNRVEHAPPPQSVTLPSATPASLVQAWQFGFGPGPIVGQQ